MRIAVIGAGAVGSVYGSMLRRGGHDVLLVDISPLHVEAIRQNGVVLVQSDGTTEVVEVPITQDTGDARDADAVLVLTKTLATKGVGSALLPVLRDDAIVVTLQNGIGNDHVLAQILGAHRVVQGSTTVGAELLAPGRVRPSGGAIRGASLTSLQKPGHLASARRTAELCTALEASGLPSAVVADVGSVVWQKLAMASIGPLCAVLHTTVADVVARPASRQALEKQFNEIVAVAAAEGVALDRDSTWQHALATFATIGEHLPSIAVDLNAGRPTEIESQSGEVQRRGRFHGVPTPATDLVTSVFRALSAQQRERA